MRQQFPSTSSTQFARERVDRGRRKSKKKKSTAGDVVPHPSISILFPFFLPPVSSFLSIFVYSSSLLLGDSGIVDAHLLYFHIPKRFGKSFDTFSWWCGLWAFFLRFLWADSIQFNLFFCCGENETSAAPRIVLILEWTRNPITWIEMRSRRLGWPQSD